MIKLFFFLIFTGFALTVFGYSLKQSDINPALLNKQWSAYWIHHPESSVIEYGVYHFRRTITLDEIPEKFIVHVSADNRYKLYVNEHFVCLGPSRGDLLHWRFESIDLSPYFQKGNNIISAEVWNYAQDRPVAQFSYMTGFILQGNSETESIVNTDSSWRVSRDEAYTSESGKTPDGNYIVVGPCVRIDASKYPWGWKSLFYDDSAWYYSKQYIKGSPRSFGSEIKWGLTPRQIPLMENIAQNFDSIRRAENIVVPVGFLNGEVPLIVTSNKNISFLIDQGVLTTAYPEIVTTGGQGSEIKLTYAEALLNPQGNKGNRNEVEGKKISGYADYFMPDGGEDRTFKTLWFRTWRYIRVDIKTKGEPLTINKMSSEFTAYPLEEKARFVSDDARLDSIWTVGWRTARLCAGETYFDCPYYEQLQYVGDTRIQALISLYVSGDDRLMRKSIQMFDESRISEGLTMSRYPAYVQQLIPPYSLFWVDMVHDYWMLRDEPDFVKERINGIKNVLDWFIRRIDKESGMLGGLPYWNFVDWSPWKWRNGGRFGGVPDGASNGLSSILSLHLAYSARHASEIMDYFGEDGNYYSNIADSLIKATVKLCRDEKTVYLADTPEKYSYSIHAQLFGILTGAFPEDEKQKILKKAIADQNLIEESLYFKFYLSRALQATNLENEYLNTLGEWYEMLKLGLTTFPERLQRVRSDCHAWSAAPLYDFFSVIAGINSISPGFKSVSIKPSFGKLTHIEGEMPHPKGLIKFNLTKTKGNKLKGFVQIPEGINGTLVWDNKKYSVENLKEINL